MARTGRGEVELARQQAIATLVHELSNCLHSLGMRLALLAQGQLDDEGRAQLQAAHRLSEKGVSQLAQLRRLAGDPPPRPGGRADLTARQNPR
jgi:hypothetical protein